MRLMRDIFLALMLMSLGGSRDSASPAGGPPDSASHTDSVGQAAGESAATLAARAMDSTLPQAQRREAASQMMTATAPDAAIPAMQSLLATSDDESVREMMAKRLGDLRDMDSSPKLIDAMDDPSPRVQEAAASPGLKCSAATISIRSKIRPNNDERPRVNTGDTGTLFKETPTCVRRFESGINNDAASGKPRCSLSISPRLATMRCTHPPQLSAGPNSAGLGGARKAAARGGDTPARANYDKDQGRA